MNDSEERNRLWLQWEGCEQGQFALEKQKRLLLQMSSHWRRRGQALLEIECHCGYFLEAFWESGFEVSGTDRSPELLQRARGRLGKRADLHLAHPEHLTFEDKSFDYVLAISALDMDVDPGKVVQEAARICKKELLIGFMNRRSCGSLQQKLPNRLGGRSSASRAAAWRTAGETRKLLQEHLGRSPDALGSVLCGPLATWRRKSLAERVNGVVLPVPVGTFCAMRLDLTWERTGTPLIAWNPKESTAAQGAQPTGHRPAL